MKSSRVHARLAPILVGALTTLLIGAAGTQAFSRESPGQLQQRGSTYSTNVRYSLSELATESGLEKVYRRIKRAAHSVCTLAAEPADVSRIRHYWQCYDEAVAQAVAEVSSQKLTALHRKEADRRKGAG